MKNSIKIKTLLQLYEMLPEEERIIVDVLRQIIKENIPPDFKEKYLTMFPSFMVRREFVLYGHPPFRVVELKREFC